MKNLTITKTVSVSFTADQWELFDEPGRDEAAIALNAALEAAINAPGATESSAYRDMQPVCKEYEKLGASDGEADYLIEKVIRKALIN